jgi:hypothetical protein
MPNPNARAKARLLLDNYYIKRPYELNLEQLANAECLMIEEAELNSSILV